MGNNRLEIVPKTVAPDLSDVILETYDNLRNKIVEIRNSREEIAGDEKLSLALRRAREEFVRTLES